MTEIIVKLPESEKPTARRWFGRAISPSKSLPTVRSILEHACGVAKRIVPHDPQVQDLFREYDQEFFFPEGAAPPDDTDRQTAILHELDELVERVIVDALRRQKHRWIKVYVSTCPDAGLLRCNVTIFHRRMEARRHIEVAIT